MKTTIRLRDNFIIYYRQLDTGKEYSTGVTFSDDAEYAIRFCVIMNKAMLGTKREYFYVYNPIPDNRPVRVERKRWSTKDLS